MSRPRDTLLADLTFWGELVYRPVTGLWYERIHFLLRRLPAQECVEALLVHLAAVCNASDRDEFRRVVDDVKHAPVPDSDAPLVLIAFQLFASCGPRIIGQRQNFPVCPGELGRASCLVTLRVTIRRTAHHRAYPIPFAPTA